MAVEVSQSVDVSRPPKKEVEVIKVIAEKVTGYVKWYNPLKRYGFISRNDDGGDLFVHRSVISSYSKPFPSLLNGEEVEFSVVETNQGIEATYVTGPEGKPVKGARVFRRRYRPPQDSGNQEDSQTDNNLDENRPRKFKSRSRRTNRKAVTDNQTIQSNIETNSDEPKGDNIPDEKEDDSTQPPVPRERRRYRRRRPKPRPQTTTQTSNHAEDPSDAENGLNVPNPNSFSSNRHYGRGYRRPTGNLIYANGRSYYRQPAVNGYKQWGQTENSGQSNGHPNGYNSRNRYNRGYGDSHSRPFVKNRILNRAGGVAPRKPVSSDQENSPRYTDNNNNNDSNNQSTT